MTINGDDAVDNENYEYWDETGTRNAGQDDILIAEGRLSGFKFTTHIIVESHHGGNIGIHNNIKAMNRVGGFSQTGSYLVDDPLNSIRLNFKAGARDGDTIELWRVF